MKTVFVGLSGGVDSSVAALRLKKQGYKVVGVFIKVWHPDFMVCNWEQERLDAMRVAAHLEIPFLTCDAEEAYKKNVADYFISEYLNGRTPNPDVMCNKEVKFGAFLDFAMSHGADFIATGHYAQKIDGALTTGVDSTKDQSYFLWSLSKEQLEKILLPVGESTKARIRSEAAAAGIPTAAKKDSQGICFLGHVDIPEFLSHYTELQPGVVIDVSGEAIGTHKGALVYTIGQRHGFELTNKESDRTIMYVTSVDHQKNTITVSPEKPQLESGMNDLKLRDYVLRVSAPEANLFQAQFRYHGPKVPVKIKRDSNYLTIKAESTMSMPAKGQSVVLYAGNVCVGGGVVD